MPSDKLGLSKSIIRKETGNPRALSYRSIGSLKSVTYNLYCMANNLEVMKSLVVLVSFLSLAITAYLLA
jgi:hypothetical protein